jgi:hypothetical protein
MYLKKTEENNMLKALIVLIVALLLFAITGFLIELSKNN